MNDAQRKLLDDHKTIILPNEIDHDVYQLIVEAAILYPDDEIDLYCRGDGGSARNALAMIDVIQRHGKFIGLLAGEANSAHTTVWAACAYRYVYPHGAIGVHKIIWDGVDMVLTSDICDVIKIDYEKSEWNVSYVLASASNKDAQFWFDSQQKGNIPYKMVMFCADEIIQMEMALPIADRHKHPQIEKNGTMGASSIANAIEYDKQLAHLEDVSKEN